MLNPAREAGIAAVLFGLSPFVFAADAAAQNVTLLSRTDTRTSTYAGIWGWDAPNGATIVAIGHRTGVVLYDTTDPKKPKELAYLKGNSSTWRDQTFYKGIMYGTSEGHSGFRMADLTNPAKPVDLGYQQTSAFSRCHTVALDPDAGLLIVNGTNRGMVFFDIKTDPKKPKEIGRYTSSYCHDSFHRRGKSYTAEIYSGRFRILNTTNLASIKVLSSTNTPRRFTHNVWVTEDDKLALTTDERSSSPQGFVQAFDISTPSAPKALGKYQLTGVVVHNVYISGRTAYISYYADGFHVVDFANPSSPKLLARYDTTSGTRGFTGAWGVWNFADSGVCYVSDYNNGLFAFQVNCGHLNRFGAGTAGTGKVVPRMRFDGASPRVAASKLRLELSNLRPNAKFAVLVSSKQGTGGEVLGVKIHVDIPSALWFWGQADGNGRAKMPAPVPDDNNFANARLYAQILVADPQGPQGLAASRGMWAGVCAK